MKISTKGRYGLRILIDLALHDGDSPRLIRDIARSQEISEKYISRLMVPLRRAGLIRSIRGARGGFRLAKGLEEITLLDVVEVMEGPVSIVDCVSTPEGCSRASCCRSREIWTDLNAEIRDSMRKIRLLDILCSDPSFHPLNSSSDQ